MEAMFNSQANLVVLNILLMRWVGKTSGIESSLHTFRVKEKRL